VAGDKGSCLRLYHHRHVFDAAPWELVFRKAEIEAGSAAIFQLFATLAEQTALLPVLCRLICRARE
jgi:hypothetical protein